MAASRQWTPAAPNATYTRSPSVAGVSEAYPFDPKVPTVGFFSATVVPHRVLPSAADTHSTRQR